MRALLSAVFLLAFAGAGNCADEKKELTVKEQIAEINKDVEKLSVELNKKFGEAKTPAEKTEIRNEFLAGRTKAGEKMMVLAKENPKDEAAFDAVMAANTMGAKDAGDFLVANFADDVRIVKVIPQLGGGDNGPKTLNLLAEKSKSKDVQGAAKFAAVSAEIESADYPRTGKPLPEKEAVIKIAAAAGKLAAIVKEYGDIKTAGNGRPGAASPTVAEAAKKIKFFVDNLTVGKMAPDAECELMEEGKKAKLSDYRGNVVVLDIWATWCGPCIAMIPHERDMVKKLEGKKFKLVSVSADAKKDTLTAFLEKSKDTKNDMPWTHWWAGNKGGLTEEYQVRFYPTVYIIDGKGVIRGKHLRGDDLEQFVEKLLAEASPK